MGRGGMEQWNGWGGGAFPVFWPWSGPSSPGIRGVPSCGTCGQILAG